MKRSKGDRTASRVETSEKQFDDPFLLTAGTDTGNGYRRKRAIVRMEHIDMENTARIRQLRLENEKLRAQLTRLQTQAEETGRIESRFEHLSSIIMESQMEDESDSIEEEEEEEK